MPDRMTTPARRWPVVLTLGTAQTLAWASSYYLPAILAEPIAAGTGTTRAWVVAAFSALMDAEFGWRLTCLAWAGLHLAVGLPLNYLLMPRGRPLEAPAGEPPPDGRISRWQPRREMVLLAIMFAATAFVTSAMAAHL